MATTIAPVTHNAFIKALKAVAPPELLETIVPDPEFTNAPASAAAADATASDLKYPCATQRAPRSSGPRCRLGPNDPPLAQGPGGQLRDAQYGVPEPRRRS